MSAVISQLEPSVQAVRHCLALVCLGFLTLAAIFLLARLAKTYAAKIGRLPTVVRFGTVAATVGVIAFGGAKPPAPSHLWRFEFLNGLHDAGSTCTAEGIDAHWTYDADVAGQAVNASYQDLTITNSLGVCTDELHPLTPCLVADSSHFWPLADATNMRVIIWAEYVRPPETHTNGVYRLPGVMRTMDDQPRYVTPTIRIDFADDVGGIATLTPTDAPPGGLLSTLADELPNEGENQ